MSQPVSTTVALCASVTLHHIRTDRFKTAHLSVATIRPAHPILSPQATLLYGVLRRGSTRYPSQACLNRALDELYGTTLTISNYLYGDNHILSYTAEMPEDVYLPAHDIPLPEEILSLLADLMLHPLTDEDGCLRREAVEAEKRVLCDSLRAMRNDTRAYAGNRLCELMCRGEPYGLSVSGTEESVSRMTAAELTAHLRDGLAETRCEVMYVGRASVEDVRRAWDAAFGAWSPRPAPVVYAKPHPLPTAPRAFEEEMPVAQGKLCMGWSCGENDRTLEDARETAALQVCNELFGGMQSSLLFRRVRERLGLCYYCESVLDMTKGILWVSCGIRSDHRDRAEAAITACLSTLQNGQVTAQEVEAAKLSLANRDGQMADSPGAMAFTCIRRRLSGTDVSGEAWRSALAAVTVEDVAKAARRFWPDTVFFLKGTAPAEGDGDRDGGDDRV